MTIEELIERLNALPGGAQIATIYIVTSADGIERKLQTVDYESGRVILS